MRINESMSKLYVLLVIVLVIFNSALFADVHAFFEPISTVYAVTAFTVAGIGLLYRPIGCKFTECCDQGWIESTTPNLKAKLEANVFGQHLVVNSVVNSLNGHLRHEPSKALIFSFQGWTGTGKNLVAKIIAENMYRKGVTSKYVHVLSATKHFFRPELKAYYQDQIRDWIIGNVSSCPHQLFIFDEVEKMPEGVLDVLKPFVDFTEPVQGVDYRKAVYILLGNAGGQVLFDKTYEHYISGRKRHDLKLKDIESALWKDSYYEKGGLKHSSLITSHLITAHVPFLPLEKVHVRACIKNDIETKNFTLATQQPQLVNAIVDRVMEQLSFTPARSHIYSSTGCKRVYEKVNLILEEYID